MVLLILSLFLIINPSESIRFILIAFGCLLVVNGIMHLIAYFSIKNEYRYFSFELVQAIVCVVFGFVFIINTTAIASFLPFIIAIWVILESIIRLQISLNLRDLPNSKWIMMLLLSIFTLSLGIVILFNPFKTAEVVTMVCGIILLMTEVINIFESITFMLKVKAK